jgi:hypothetical protein
MATIRFEHRIDELTIEKWEFYQTDNNIYLDGYVVLMRESTLKRNYTKVLKRYDRLMERDSTIKESEVPFTDEIRKEAIKQFTDTIRCIKWSER